MGKRRRKNWQKYGLWTAATLAGLGWQLTTGTVAEADEVADTAPVAESVVTAETKEESKPTSLELEPGASNAESRPEDETAVEPGTVADPGTVAPLALSGDGVVLSQPGKHKLRRVKANKPVDDQQSTTAVVAATPVSEVVSEKTDALPKQPKRTEAAIDQWMPNKTLQTAVLTELRREPQADHKTWTAENEITQQDMLRLDALSITGNAESSGISTYIDGHTEFSLKGIEYAKNLEHIALGGGLANNSPYQVFGDVVDLSPLAGLTHLRSAILDNNRIKDISPLKNLNNLEQLYLTFNQISDFRPLNGKDFWQLTITEQYITLPTIKVDPEKRTAHMLAPYYLPSGDFPGLYSPGEWVEQIMDFHIDENNHNDYYFNRYIYHNIPNDDVLLGGDIDENDWGNLTYVNIPDQKPGDAEPLEEHQIQLPNYYYLVAMADVEPGDVVSDDSDVEWYVIQPYTTAKQAGKITVHYQDEGGNSLEKDHELPMGYVDDAYRTTPLKIKDYTLSKTPENAQGVYIETPIEITYVYRKNATEKPSVTPPVVTPPVVTPPTVTPPTDGGTTPTTKPTPGQQPDQVDTGSKPDQVKPVPVSVAGSAADQVDGETTNQAMTPAKPHPSKLPPVMPTTAQSKGNTLLPQTDGQSAYQLLGVIGLLIAFWGLAYRGKD
ncbi:MucBP domain-containing protein [Levilactobacillus lanxiensis]|uniref:MucBP domain-containing protein n=1 Tax=Levilactobacillus lanxiensis TaxID=2799568 RepID=A0ABW4D1A8_9LACO|nr:MucBP domain-containing protein [Levilactobacillus lanxiensis]